MEMDQGIQHIIITYHNCPLIPSFDRTFFANLIQFTFFIISTWTNESSNLDGDVSNRLTIAIESCNVGNGKSGHTLQSNDEPC